MIGQGGLPIRPRKAFRESNPPAREPGQATEADTNPLEDPAWSNVDDALERLKAQSSGRFRDTASTGRRLSRALGHAGLRIFRFRFCAFQAHIAQE